MLQLGTRSPYLCIENKKTGVMKNTDFNYNVLGSIVSSEDSLTALFEIIDDLDLEITGVSLAL